jgi:hypothetical protein
MSKRKKVSESVAPRTAAPGPQLPDGMRSVADLNRFFVCQICKGYIRDVHTISECLHIFCKICLFEHFESDTTCPTCHVPLGPDPMKKSKCESVPSRAMTCQFLCPFALVVSTSTFAAVFHLCHEHGPGLIGPCNPCLTNCFRNLWRKICSSRSPWRLQLQLQCHLR